MIYDRINEINVSDLPSGIYLLTIKTSSQKIFYKKIYIIN
ncbi:MAG: T9SS type A sorting domain-containing protein [Saprospiraceae bacterium]|nr:T9SS type A sorting domain-containing protein [Candidatus Vicinibacter affinis]